MSADQEQDVAQSDYPPDGSEALEQYSDIETMDGELVIFDESKPDAWIQCSFWIQVRMME